MRTEPISHAAAAIALALVLAQMGCSAAGDSPGDGDRDGDSDCTGEKCDIPDGPDEELCELRRGDAFNENQRAFTLEFLRWSCNDVEGVTWEDRGQEYCEYFAIAQLPPAEDGEEIPAPSVVGRNLGEDYTFGTTEPSIDLTFHQLSQLEDDDSAVVGQCVFTSWNSDIPGPVPSCAGDDACPAVAGVAVDEETFRMKFEVNSTEAAQILVEDCFLAPESDEADPFTRGCMLNAEINDTAFRKSDTTVCAASIRLAECGCGLEGDEQFTELISPAERRGFPLGTWSGLAELPAGCRFVDLGDDSQTVVACDLTATDVIDYAPDLKGRCQTKYADNVVVHVPMPQADAVSCSPDEAGSAYTGTCTATPWLLEP